MTLQLSHGEKYLRLSRYNNSSNIIIPTTIVTNITTIINYYIKGKAIFSYMADTGVADVVTFTFVYNI